MILSLNKLLKQASDCTCYYSEKRKSLNMFLICGPISLCNIIDRIVIKVIANHLKLILGDVISEIQSTFVLFRLIL